MAQPHRQIPRPIQVFLDTKRFIQRQPTGSRGPNRDFFAGDDQGFRRHKVEIQTQIKASAEDLRQQTAAAGFVVVQMREEGLAKSYRPLNALFSRRNNFAAVGGGKVGEMYFQATSHGLESLSKLIEEKAEITPRIAENSKTGEEEERVSTHRSELGAISEVRLPSSEEKIDFSASEAVDWMSSEGVIGGYMVELFRPDFSVNGSEVDDLVRDFKEKLEDLGGVIAVEIAKGMSRASIAPSFSVDLVLGEQSRIELPFIDQQGQDRSEIVATTGLERDLDVSKHQKLLEELVAHPLVRSVELPMRLESSLEQSQALEYGPAFHQPDPDATYPIVGIIDGGVSDNAELQTWCVGSAGPVIPPDKDMRHGTFIAGLLCGASELNPAISIDLERTPCKFFDVALLPRKGLLGRYYATPDEFFDQLDAAVTEARDTLNVRVFNVSLGSPGARKGLGYSTFARMLDQIALDNDVVFVVSAGNLEGAKARPEWPSDEDQVLEMLARRSSDSDGITSPAEHMLGLTVGALNPPGLSHANEGLPAAYTRRGPGAGGARKPELAHYGGAAKRGGPSTGLRSLDVDGYVMEDAGTSFAAPLVAAKVAALDNRLGGTATRETLLALPVHTAVRHKSMGKKPLRPIAREFVGYGMPQEAERCISDRHSSITLLFSDTLPPKRELGFTFSWPKSLTQDNGKCKGQVDITLAYTPAIDPTYDSECQRVLLDAFLHQLNEEIYEDTGEVAERHTSQLKHFDNELPQNLEYTERYLLESGLKWTPIKRYHRRMPRGVGNSGDWRLSLKALTRAGEVVPVEGVRFSLLMTISDPAGEAPIYDEVRNEVLRRGLQLTDITVSQQIKVGG